MATNLLRRISRLEQLSRNRSTQVRWREIAKEGSFEPKDAPPRIDADDESYPLVKMLRDMDASSAPGSKGKEVYGPTDAWTPFKHHPRQHALWNTRSRFIAAPAGRGSGKTELAKRRLVRFLPVHKMWPGPRYFYGAPTREQAKRIAWAHLKALVPKEWLGSAPNESELIIRTVFGSELHVIGFDKPMRIEGVQWDGGVIDESCDIKPHTFDLSILPTLVWRDGWCWRIGVPKRFGVGAAEYFEFYERAIKGEMEEAEGFTWPSSDILTPAALKFARENMDLRDFEEQFNASWQTASGGIFYAFDKERNVRPCDYDPKHTILVSSDFNVDPMAWVLCHRRKNDVIEVFDEVWLRNTNTELTLQTLFDRYTGHQGGWEFYGDASSRARKTSAHLSDYKIIAAHAGFKKQGRSLHYMWSNPSQVDRFSVTNAHICNAEGQRRLFIDERCKRLIHDLRTRPYKPGTREADDKGDSGHPTDALGYLLYKLFPLHIKMEGLGGQSVHTTGGRR